MLFSAPTDAGSLYISCCSFLTFALHKMGCNQLLKLARKCSFVWYLFKIEIIFCLLLDETKNFIPCWFTSGRLVGWSVISFSPPNSEWFYANAFMQCTCVHNKLHLMPRSGHKGQSTFATKFDLLSKGRPAWTKTDVFWHIVERGGPTYTCNWHSVDETAVYTVIKATIWCSPIGATLLFKQMNWAALHQLLQWLQCTKWNVIN